MEINNKTIRHVAIYLRISREKRDENVETLQNHRQILTEFANENNLTYVEYGEVISGGKTDVEDRPKLKELLDNIEKFDAILCMELSRLSRNGLISQLVKQYCIDYDKPIITPYQTYDLANSDMDRLMFDVGSMISSHEFGVIGKRSLANKVQMTKIGLHVSGNVPYGYKRNNETKKLEIDEPAAEVIRYIFKLHQQGLGAFKIRDILNKEGYKSATGKHFNLPAIRRILKNPHYKGWTVFNVRKKYKEGGKYKYKIVDTIVVKDTHPPIIPPEVWDEVNKDRQRRMEISKKIREKPVIKSEITMLKDLIFCGVCGNKMTIRKDNKSNVGYTIKRCEYLLPNGEKCNNRGIKLEYVEKAVIIKLLNFKHDLSKYLEKILIKDRDEVSREIESRVNQLQKQLKSLEEKENKLIDLALNGVFSYEEIKDKKKEIAENKQIIIERIQKIKEKNNDINVENTSKKIKEIIEIIDNIKNNSSEKINESLKTFINKIYYERCIPEEILKLSTRNPKRKDYPFEIKIEFFDI